MIKYIQYKIEINKKEVEEKEDIFGVGRGVQDLLGNRVALAFLVVNYPLHWAGNQEVLITYETQPSFV